MKEAQNALSKLRGYTYLIFVFDILLLLHQSIANLFHMSDIKMLYGLVALVFIQVTLCILWCVKYVLSMQNRKETKTVTMYASRIRFYLIGEYFLLGMMVVNKAWLHSYMIDKCAVILLILSLIAVLKNCTVLQRQRY